MLVEVEVVVRVFGTHLKTLAVVVSLMVLMAVMACCIIDLESLILDNQ